MKNIIRLRSFAGKSINEVISFADALQQKGIEGKINAHSLYTDLIDQFDPTKEDLHLRGLLRGKIWNIEKYFGWNQSFFSQSGQDKFILNCFLKNAKKGFFVEIGAYDGIDGSNCLYFERMGWEGIAIEPSITQYDALIRNRKCHCVNKAVSDSKEMVEFIDVVDGLKQMSGLNKNYYKHSFDIIKNSKKSEIKRYQIETSTFSEIVKNNQQIDYLSIDIEGGELGLLNSIDFEFYNIKLLSVENNNPKEIDYKELLKKKNFEFYDYVGVDEIYFNKTYFNFPS